jgi:hypothetical protein
MRELISNELAGIKSRLDEVESKMSKIETKEDSSVKLSNPVGLVHTNSLPPQIDDRDLDIGILFS